jgi:hypothetical protein
MGETNSLVTMRGIPVYPNVPIAFTQGKIWHCKPYSGNDGNSGDSPDQAVKTLTQAHTLATADQNDIVLLYAESNTAASTTDYQSSALTWSKDGVHLIGVNCGAMLGQRSRIAQTSTVKTVEDLFTLSADNCLISNIEIFQGVASSTATSPRAMVVSGQRNRIVNCQISGMGDTSMDATGARSLTVSGSENIFQHCYIGLDTVIRATNVIEVGITGTAGSKATRNIFEDCMFNTYTSGSTAKMIAASYVDRFVLFNNCLFCAVQGITSAVAPTGAISTANMNGQVWMYGGGVYGFADVTTADATDVLVLTHGALAANIIDMGVAKGTDVAA